MEHMALLPCAGASSSYIRRQTSFDKNKNLSDDNFYRVAALHSRMRLCCCWRQYLCIFACEKLRGKIVAAGWLMIVSSDAVKCSAGRLFGMAIFARFARLLYNAYRRNILM